MKIAISPCPNDTFIYHALIHGLVEGTPQINVEFADIDRTNEWAKSINGPDLIKVSFGALPFVHGDYQFIPCGGALGKGCGPLVVTRDGSEHVSFIGKTVAVPSLKSTAYLLFRLWVKQNHFEDELKIVVMPFHEIMPAVARGTIDAGLVIHEARFTYQDYGLKQVVDLGDWWERDTGNPIPLGAILVKKSWDPLRVTEWIQASLRYAWDHPDASKDFVIQNAQEMSPDVVKSHIQLYVNEYSYDLGKTGFEAIRILLKRALDAGVFEQSNSLLTSFLD